MDDNTKKLLDVLKNQPSISIPISEKEKQKFRSSKKPGEIEPTHINIPPNKAIITFNKNAKLFKTVKPKFKTARIDLPENWTNFESKYGQYVTKPENQQKCGSCFAFAAAGAINDVFIFGRNLNFNPDISPLSILSCVNDKTCNLQCDGGDPLGVIDYIQSRGITTNYCMNYNDYCNSSPSCYQPVKKAFDEAKREQTFRSTSQTIQMPQCGCCSSGNFSYYVNQPTLVSTTTGLNIDGRTDAVEIIKQHLYAYGAAISGYVVYGNFVYDKSNGKFEKTSGIYIESENYCPATVVENGKEKTINPFEFMGCHAIAIVGWGVEKRPIKLDDGTTLTNTPYWYCRNSWSKDWGLNGYFKMAMYQKVGNKEINNTTAFERINIVTINNDSYQMGGVIIFTPKRFLPYDIQRPNCDEKAKSYKEPSPVENKGSPTTSPPTTSPTLFNKNISSNNNLNNNLDIKNSNSFTINTKNPITNTNNTNNNGSNSKSNMDYFLIFLSGIVSIIIAVILYKKYKKYRKRK